MSTFIFCSKGSKLRYLNRVADTGSFTFSQRDITLKKSKIIFFVFGDGIMIPYGLTN